MSYAIAIFSLKKAMRVLRNAVERVPDHCTNRARMFYNVLNFTRYKNKEYEKRQLKKLNTMLPNAFHRVRGQLAGKKNALTGTPDKDISGDK